jgi:hypothetical protein
MLNDSRERIFSNIRANHPPTPGAHPTLSIFHTSEADLKGAFEHHLWRRT